MQLTKDEIDALWLEAYKVGGYAEQEHRFAAAVIAAHTAKVLEDVEPVGYIHPEDIKNIAASDVEHCEIYSKPFSWQGAVYESIYPGYVVASITAQRDKALARVAEMEKDAARYQYLRKYAYIELQCDSPRSDDWRPEYLDAAIDAALTKGQP